MWLIRFSIFRVREYRFHTNIFAIIVRCRFLFYSQLKFIAFCDKLNFISQILVKIFIPIKIKIKGFRFSYYNHVFSIIVMI